MKRKKGKHSILKDQVRRLLPKLSYISDTDEPVKLSKVPITTICERIARGDLVAVESGEEFFEPLLLDPYWCQLWRLLQKWPAPIRVLILGEEKRTIFIISDSLILETKSLET
jgi:hypothetical protein